MGRAERITSAVKAHDRELYCERDMEGKLCIFREGHSWENHPLKDGNLLRVLRPVPHLVFALTDSWSIRGRSVDWGIEPIMKRLKAMDLWNNDIVGILEEQDLKDEESAARDRDNMNESFLYEFRDQFKKTFDGINTSSLAKTDLRKKNEKRIKQF